MREQRVIGGYMELQPQLSWRRFFVVFGANLLLIAAAFAATWHDQRPETTMAVATGAAALCWVAGLVLVWPRRGRRISIVATTQGLNERFLLRRQRHYPWSAVRGLERSEQDAVIETDLGPIRIGPGGFGWHSLIHLVESRLRGGELAPAQDLSRESLSALLGLAVGESRCCRLGPLSLFVTSFWQVAAVVLGGIFLVQIVVINRLARPLWGGLVSSLLSIAAAAALPRLLARCSLVRATIDGLSMPGFGRGRQETPWSAVEWHELRGDVVLVGTSKFDVPLDARDPRCAEVLELIDRVLAAKRAGAVLPRMSDVPAGALSRAEDGADERGITRSRPG